MGCSSALPLIYSRSTFFWLEGGFCWFLFFNYFAFYVYILPHVYKCTMHMARAFVDWNRMLALLELDLEVVVSHHVDTGD